MTYFLLLHGYAPHWRGNVEHLAVDGYYMSRCLHSTLHVPCKALLCLRRCLQALLCGEYVLEWSVNADASRAALWNTWVTLSGEIFALAGEHCTTCMHNVSKLAGVCVLWLWIQKRLCPSFQISFVKIAKLNLKKKKEAAPAVFANRCALVCYDMSRLNSVWATVGVVMPLNVRWWIPKPKMQC